MRDEQCRMVISIAATGLMSRVPVQGAIVSKGVRVS